MRSWTHSLSIAMAMVTALAAVAWGQGFHAVTSRDGIDVWAVGAGGLVYRSFDRGVSWTSRTLGSTGLWGVGVQGLTVVVVGDSGKVWRSENSGGAWGVTAVTGAPDLRGLAAPSAAVWYVVGEGGTILKSVDGGGTWTGQSSGTGATLNAVRFTDELNGWAVGDQGTVVRTVDGGASWNPVTTGAVQSLRSVDQRGMTVWVVGSKGTAYRSEDGGTNWSPVNLKLDARSEVMAVWLEAPNTVYLAGGGGFVRRSVDGGTTWEFQQHYMQAQISDLHFTGSRGWAVSNKKQTMMSTADGGATWTFPTGTTITRSWVSKLNVGGSGYGKGVVLSGADESTLYFAINNRVYRSRDEGETWPLIATIDSCTAVNAFIVSPRDTNVMIAAVKQPFRLVRSEDGGASWYTTLTHYYGNWGIPLEMDPDHPDTVYFGGDSDSLFRSTDGGKNWVRWGGIPGGIPMTTFRSPCDIVAVPDSANIVLIGDGVTGSGQGQYYKSTDWGRNFALITTRPVGSSEIPGMACSRLRNSTTLGTNWGSGGVQRSTDYGATWPNVNPAGSAWGIDIAKDDPNCVIFGVYSGGLSYLSLDGGTTFAQTSLPGSNDSFYARDRGLIIAEQTSGLYKMDIAYAYTPSNTQALAVTVPNGGEVWTGGELRNITWNAQNIALARIEYRLMPGSPWQTVADVEGYLGTYEWRVPNDPTTEAKVRVRDLWDSAPTDTSNAAFSINAVVAAEERAPAAFALWQNQPNPFQGTTLIRYALPIGAQVSLEVFDLQGQRVATLARGDQGPGIHSVTFGPGALTVAGERLGKLSSGMYFYRFRAGSFLSTRKMLVLR